MTNLTSLLFVPVALMLLTAAAVPAPPDERPPGENEWGIRPEDGMTLRRNPPPFVCRPQTDAKTYVIQCSRTKDFAKIEYEVADLTLNAHCPSQPFPPGEWYWRFAFVNTKGERSEFSSARRFIIPENAVIFPRPPDAELFQRIPAHPRLFLRPEQLPELRAKAKAELKPQLDALIASCDKLLNSPPDVTEPPKYPEGMQRLTAEWGKIWWGNRVRTIAVLDGAATLGFTYLLTDEKKYADEGKRLLLAAAQWDPLGATDYRYNDEAGMPYAYLTSRAYTWLYHTLTEAEREQVRKVMTVRGARIYDHLRNTPHTWKAYNSHSNRAWHKLGEVGIAFYGEIPDAAKWISYAMDVFCTVYPVWNDSDGGWHEGPSYWDSYISRVSWWLDVARECFGIDGYKLPYFSNAGDFALYQIPPGSQRGAFGDLGNRANAASVKTLVASLARHTGNPYWQWYVEQAPGSELDPGYFAFLRALTPKPQPKPPTDLPQSKLFAGTGVAALHSDLVDRSKDVQILLKSSPYGSWSHGYDAQNSFIMEAFGRALFIRTGERGLHGSPHHTQWMWETKSTNSILVNGEGQRKHTMNATGQITEFYTSRELDYVVGDASGCYDGRLRRFTRAILFIKPTSVLIWDRLEAPEPATFQWLLHAEREMQIGENYVVSTNEHAVARAMWLAPAGLKITQSNVMDPPPAQTLVQWHVTAETPTPAANMDFITVIQVYRTGQPTPPPAKLSQVGGTLEVSLPLDDGQATVKIAPSPTGARGEVTAQIMDADGKVKVSFESPGRGTAPPPGSKGA